MDSELALYIAAAVALVSVVALIVVLVRTSRERQRLMKEYEDAEDELQERELRNALQAAANCLPRRERELWQLHAEDGMSVSEIAATTGIGPRSVSVMLSAV